MLMLSRRPGEEIQIGDGITVRITQVKGNQVRIGIDAPHDVKIIRSELQDRRRSDREPRAAGQRK
ncbi:UNVERIFIED_CONTAM: hypothetical protein GTU68_034980 [Idotea baltica]|nr:hypothetical protein [Idotea baltica]